MLPIFPVAQSIQGTIAQRADGTWWARVDLGYVKGRRRRKAVYGATREAVAQKLTDVLHDQNRGVPIPIAEGTVGRFLEDWLAGVVKPSLRPGTYRTYESAVRGHLVPALGRTPLGQLTAQQVQRWIGTAVATSSASRVAYARKLLIIALNQAVAWRLVPANVAHFTRPPEVTPREIQPLDEAQARKLLKATADHRLGALLGVALATGLRQGELLALTWPDVDVEAGTITIRRTLYEIDGEAIIGEPKTARGKRTVLLPRFVREHLQRHRRAQLEDRLKAGPEWHETGLVFTTRTGTYLRPPNVRRDFKRLCRQAGVPVVRFHDLRHSKASLLLAEGVDARTVMELLGHANITVTLGTYGHMLRRSQESAMRKVQRLLG